ncbi:hypothetical protein [Enterococcus mundtii]|uniref:Uncharacterized protein n=2 Tax=Enterococcus TaxID=1350 RepID=A0A848N057_ENTMU|nr:hypothetical protein [Enterococcus mundtii]NMP58303.1 hypothetical protein [Enterococcus mundtii]
MITNELKIIFFGKNSEYQRLFESNESERFQPGKDYQVQMFDACNNEIEKLIIQFVKGNKLLTLQDWEDFSDNLPLLLFPQNEKKLLYFSEYYESMNRSPENHLTNVFEGAIQAGNLQTDGQRLFYTNAVGNEITINLLKEHGYKTVLDMAMNHQTTILFSLSHFNQRAIDDYNFFNRSETAILRESIHYIYREFSQLKNFKEKIFFINNVEIVPPPWVEGNYLKNWQAYIKQAMDAEKSEIKTNQEPINNGKIVLFGHENACETLAKIPEIEEKLVNKDYKAHMFDACNKAIEKLMMEHVEKGNLITRKDWETFSNELPSLLESQGEKLAHVPEYLRVMGLERGNQINRLNKIMGVFFTKQSPGNLNTDGKKLYYEFFCYKDHKMKAPVKGLEIQAYEIAVEMAIKENVPIYISLDGIDMRGIYSKIPKHNVELRPKKFRKNDFLLRALRQIYQNHSELGEKVLFFENGKKVDPPWIKGAFVQDWQRYFERKKIKLEQKNIPSSLTKINRMDKLMQIIHDENVIQTVRKMRKDMRPAFREKVEMFDKQASALNEQRIRQQAQTKVRRHSVQAEK